MQKNSSQERAVSHDQGPMMLLAGPGSGKTTTITRRVANLIKESMKRLHTAVEKLSRA